MCQLLSWIRECSTGSASYRRALRFSSPPTRRSEQGLTLIEIVISIGILGLIGAAIGSYFLWSFSVFNSTDVKATQESLARSQMEYVKASPWNGSGLYPLMPATIIPSGYSVTGNNTLESPTTQNGQQFLTFGVGVPGAGGLQKITVVVRRTYLTQAGSSHTDNVTLEGYKGNR